MHLLSNRKNMTMLLCFCLYFMGHLNITLIYFKQEWFYKQKTCHLLEPAEPLLFFFSPLLVPSRKSISKDNGSAKPSFVLQTGLQSGLSLSCMRTAQNHVTARQNMQIFAFLQNVHIIFLNAAYINQISRQLSCRVTEGFFYSSVFQNCLTRFWCY